MRRRSCEVGILGRLQRPRRAEGNLEERPAVHARHVHARGFDSVVEFQGVVLVRSSQRARARLWWFARRPAKRSNSRRDRARQRPGISRDPRRLHSSGKLAACNETDTAIDKTNRNFRMNSKLSSEIFPPQPCRMGFKAKQEMLHIGVMDTPPPPPPPGAPPPLPPRRERDATERQWAIGIHLSALLGFAGPHLLNVICPLIIWLIKKQESPYLDSCRKTSGEFPDLLFALRIRCGHPHRLALVAGDWIVPRASLRDHSRGLADFYDHRCGEGKQRGRPTSILMSSSSFSNLSISRGTLGPIAPWQRLPEERILPASPKRSDRVLLKFAQFPGYR